MAKGTKAARAGAPGNVRGSCNGKAKDRAPHKPRGQTPAATNMRLRTRIVALRVENPDMTVADMALELKVSAQRVEAYMTPEMAEEVERLRCEGQTEPTLEEIDLAMRRQARLGNVQAARLVYLRNTQQEEVAVLPTLEELEAELISLKKMERAKRKEQE